MITTGSPRTNAAKTEIINVDYGYAGGPCKGYRTFQPWNFKPRPSTPEFSTPNFSTMNLSTPDSYWDEEFMVEKPEVEKCGFDLSRPIRVWVAGHFNPRLLNPIGVWG